MISAQPVLYRTPAGETGVGIRGKYFHFEVVWVAEGADLPAKQIDAAWDICPLPPNSDLGGRVLARYEAQAVAFTDARAEQCTTCFYGDHTTATCRKGLARA
jgi:hypothetical protein